MPQRPAHPAPARPPVSDHVFGALLEAVLAGRYAPGEKLPTQRALAADLGVTMGPVREAVKRLEQMGLVEVRHGDAMRVRDWRAHGGLDVVAHLLLRAGGVDPEVLAHVMEARGLMLADLAELATRQRGGGRADELARLADRIAAAPDAETAQRLDFAFFSELAQGAGNLVFVLVMNSIRDLYFAHADRLPVTARHVELADLYRRAARAIARGEVRAARAAVAELAARQRERVEAAL